jgi:DegV family protein with EDD domain
MLRIVTDGAADMPVGWEKEYQIDILPIGVDFGDHVYQLPGELDSAKFYQLCRERREIPKTSLPSPGQIATFYRRIAQKGDTILSVHLASKLSGTFSAVKLAIQEMKEDIKVIPFDSLAGSAICGFMCREARLMDRAGENLQQIMKRMEHIRQRLMVVFTLDNVDFARYSGRINSLKGAIVSLLRIKPIVILSDGLLNMAERVRTRQKSLDKIIELLKKRMDQRKITVAVVHAADPVTAQNLAQRIKGIFNIKDLIITELALPVAAHLGPGTVGFAAYEVEEG